MSFKCTLCGEPMEAEESMFKYHGSLGPCPKPPLKKVQLDPAGEPKLDMTVIEREALSILGIVQILCQDKTIQLKPELAMRVDALLLTASVRRNGA